MICCDSDSNPDHDFGKFGNSHITRVLWSFNHTRGQPFPLRVQQIDLKIIENQNKKSRKAEPEIWTPKWLVNYTMTINDTYVSAAPSTVRMWTWLFLSCPTSRDQGGGETAYKQNQKNEDSHNTSYHLATQLQQCCNEMVFTASLSSFEDTANTRDPCLLDIAPQLPSDGADPGKPVGHDNLKASSCCMLLLSRRKIGSVLFSRITTATQTHKDLVMFIFTCIAAMQAKRLMKQKLFNMTNHSIIPRLPLQ